MKVTAWNNGKHDLNGAGYGLKIDAIDRDKYFNKEWKEVILELEGEKDVVVANVDKRSFWDSNCRELINIKIGQWLINNKKVPWRKGHPPKMNMEQIGENNRFKVEIL